MLGETINPSETRLFIYFRPFIRVTWLPSRERVQTYPTKRECFPGTSTHRLKKKRPGRGYASLLVPWRVSPLEMAENKYPPEN